MLETEQDSIDHADIDAPLPDGLVTEPVNINHDKQDAYRTHELHYFGKSTQIVFVLHINIIFNGE